MSSPAILPVNKFMARLIRPISKFMPYRAKGTGDWRDQEALQNHICYPQDPTRAGEEVRMVLSEMRTGLPLVKCPVQMICSRNDMAIAPPESHAELIFQALGSQDKHLTWIEGSGHVLTRDLKRQSVFEITAEFISRESLQAI